MSQAGPNPNNKDRKDPFTPAFQKTTGRLVYSREELLAIGNSRDYECPPAAKQVLEENKLYVQSPSKRS